MYRAATVAVLDAGVDPDDTDAVARAVAEARSRSAPTAGAEVVQVDGVDVAVRIRGAEVTRAVSPVSAVPAVRRQLVDQQRALVAAADAVVVEGRDIGTVVLPDATLKIYLTAAPEVRAAAAGRPARASPTPARSPRWPQDLRRRDEYDSSRADSPLRPAEDAVVVDSTDLDRQAVVDRIVELARVGRPGGGAGMTEHERAAARRRDRRPAQRRQVHAGQPVPGPPRRRRPGHPGRDPRPDLLRGAVERQAVHRRRHRRLGPEGHRPGRVDHPAGRVRDEDRRRHRPRRRQPRSARPTPTSPRRASCGAATGR